MSRSLRFAVPSVLLAVLIGCTPAASAQVARSALARDTSPDVAPADAAELVAGNTAFALALYRTLRDQGGNLFISPHSISTALAMAYAGARGETERQMAEALRFTLPQERLHAALNALDLTLAGREAELGHTEGTGFQLHIANALWGQAGYAFLPEFLDALAAHYDAGMRLVDFVADAEGARRTINAWVADQTRDRIRDLIPQGALDELTRLVLTNAIYFNASWEHRFEEAATADAPFFLLDGTSVEVPTMHQTETFLYVVDPEYTAIQFPYIGGKLAMTAIMPAPGEFDAYDAELTPERLERVLEGLQAGRVHLALPKFGFESQFSLVDSLAELGMVDAFVPGSADLSGLDGTRDLFISDVVHKAFVEVNETGTEAAAATAVIVAAAAMPAEPIEVAIDHPFLFLIRDRETGAVLFLGRVVDPS